MYPYQSTYITKDVMATKGQRFANFIIDMLIRFGIGFVFEIAAEYLSRYFGYNTLYNWLSDDNTFLDLLYGYLFDIIYFIILESFTQRSIAKYMTGTKVIMENGAVPSFGTIVKRSLCRIIPFEPFSFLGDAPRGWHDTISNTLVVDIKKYEEAMRLKNSFDEIGTVTE